MAQPDPNQITTTMSYPCGCQYEFINVLKEKKLVDYALCQGHREQAPDSYLPTSE